MSVLRSCRKDLKSLPDNINVTRSLCIRFCGYLVFDGKWFPVKGYPDDIVLLWGIDYFTHDIPHFELGTSENYIISVQYFVVLKNINYPLQYLVCDDNDAFKMAARYVYPKVIIQTCLNHYKENIRRDLCIRSQDTYTKFFFAIKKIFKERLCLPELAWKVAELNAIYGKDENCSRWLTSLMLRKAELTAYHQFVDAPNTTNLIESYNSHLEARLKVLRGFESYHSAKLWINGYILRRRLKAFTDCGKKFKHLNGVCSLEKTIRRDLKLPKLFN